VGQQPDGATAFGTVYEEHVDAIYGFLARRVGPQLAEELTAQTFTEAFDHRDRFDPERGTRSAWLFGIAVNLLRRHYRHEERTLRAMAAMAARTQREQVDEEAVTSKVVADHTWPRVARALSEMSAGERDVLLLHAWADLPYASIAAVLDIPIGTVRSRLSRSRARLSRVLEDDPSLDTWRPR
jgi:RNA polymerase sigma-70 factor (ECF subfamily)